MAASNTVYTCPTKVFRFQMVKSSAVLGSWLGLEITNTSEGCRMVGSDSSAWEAKPRAFKTFSFKIKTLLHIESSIVCKNKYFRLVCWPRHIFWLKCKPGYSILSYLHVTIDLLFLGGDSFLWPDMLMLLKVSTQKRSRYKLTKKKPRQQERGSNIVKQTKERAINETSYNRSQLSENLLQRLIIFFSTPVVHYSISSFVYFSLLLPVRVYFHRSWRSWGLSRRKSVSAGWLMLLFPVEDQFWWFSIKRCIISVRSVCKVSEYSLQLSHVEALGFLLLPRSSGDWTAAELWWKQQMKLFRPSARNTWFSQFFILSCCEVAVFTEEEFFFFKSQNKTCLFYFWLHPGACWIFIYSGQTFWKSSWCKTPRGFRFNSV